MNEGVCPSSVCCGGNCICCIIQHRQAENKVWFTGSRFLFVYLLIFLEGRYGILAEKELMAYCSPPLHPEAWLLGCLSDCSASCEASKEEPLSWHCRGDSAAVRRDCPPEQSLPGWGSPRGFLWGHGHRPSGWCLVLRVMVTQGEGAACPESHPDLAQ